MRRILLLSCIVLFSAFWTDSTGQSYGYEMEMTAFRQISETEFRFDVFLRKTAGSDPIAIESFQFQLNFNNAILNGGSLVNSFLTVDASETDLVGNLAVITDDKFVTDGTNILFASGDAGAPGSIVTVLDDNWKKVATFIVRLSSGGELHNFGDADPSLQFRTDPDQFYTLLISCEYAGTAPNFTKDGIDVTTVDDRTLIPEDGVALDTRQLAGYCFTGTSDWLTTESWNNALPPTHPAYHQVPGTNSNALINGNVTILAGQEISLTASGVNGGEVTVLTGAESLYTLSGIGNFIGGGIINFWSDGVGSTNIGNPVDLPAGTTITLQAVDFAFPPYVTWTTNPPGSGTFADPNATTTQYTTIADNVEVIATFSYTAGKSSTLADESSSNKSNIADLYASLTIAPGGSLTVDKLFNDNENGAGAIVLQSADGLPNGSLIHTNMGTEASVEQYLTKEVWHMIGQPVAFTTIDLFDFPPGGPLVWLYAHDESTNSFPSGGGSSIWQLGTPMELGKGYLSFMQNVPDPATGEKVTFSGELNAGDYTTGVEGYYALEYTQGFASAGYNFISNPYPSSLNATIDLWPKTNVDNSVWIWEGVGGESGGGQYRYWNGIDGTNGWGLGTITDGIIPPMQGFFIKANDVNPSMTIPQDSRTHGSQPFYKSSQMPDNTLRIDAEGAGGTDAIFVRFDEAATTGYDPQFDVHKMFGSESLPQLYTELTWQKLSVSTIPGMDMYQSVPMGFHCSTQGIFTLTASGLESFGLEDSIYLEDLKEGTIQCLNDNPQYSFVNSGDSPASRFLIHFGLMDLEDEPEITEANIYAYGDIIHVDLYSPGPGLVTVHSILGQELHATSIEGNSTNTIRIKGKGIYIVRLTDQEGALIGKKKVSIN